jgi:shikimate kinase
MRIYLIGLPGCGKTTLGKELANKIGYQFIDIDEYIERNACMFIDEIFEQYGEPYFRALEQSTLDELKSMDNIVISTGGGIVGNPNNKSKLDGVCIYLKVDLNIIKDRLVSSNIVRPLLEKITIEEIYEARKDKYEAFQNLTIDNTNLNDSINKIIEELGL